ncbi:uncharacterized protein [Clytia hemisphaerica]|uniref:O-methyltransferase n=1 Tax=Clytia hemisphaerica TaxID=252671 RepID=A0A7M5XIP3_9CNID
MEYVNESTILKELRESVSKENKEENNPAQEQFVRMLIKISGGKKCLVVGKQTGYSVLSAAQSLPEGGQVFGVDFHQEYVDEAYKEFFEKSKVQDKIKTIIGNHLDVMDELTRDHHDETFDVIYLVNGDVLQCANYVERAYVLSKFNGVVVIGKNMTGDKAVLDKLHKQLKGDSRFDMSVLESGSLTVLRKVSPQ